MVTRWIFFGVVLLLALQRLAELRYSRKNERRILAQEGHEVGAGHFRVMTLLHAAWFVSMLLEVFLLNRPFIPGLAAVALGLALLGQSLRYAAIRSLGWRWTVKVMVIPGLPPVDTGVYRYIRHPNYVGVILEILSVPLLHTAYLTALIFSLANALLLVVRIRVEERALAQHSDYERVFSRRPRFFPARPTSPARKLEQ
ncbi:MAG TPA: isoprenylcysteine carboxylmethyltransferase family protein [Anaerolineaceae bacterium]|nr:isoprenylcysteine carboxylmethyltransferase family protein [Anaerolineaceae bacterium]